MKIITKCVWQWVGDELIKVEEQSYEYDGPVAQAKGGGGGDSYYEELNRLYGIQADQAEYLMGLFKSEVAPMYSAWADEAKGYGSIANQEALAGKAEAGSQAQTAGAQQSLVNQLNSYGITPDVNNTQWTNQMTGIKVQGAANTAAAGTQARENVRNQGFAKQQDVIGMGMGTPTQATQAANSAANAAYSAGNLYAQNQAAQGRGISDTIRGGLNIMGYGDNGVTYGSEGGQARGLPHYAEGGYVRHLAMGGSGGGFMQPLNVQPPPPRGMPQPTTGQRVMGAAGQGGAGMGVAAMKGTIGKGAEFAGNQLGSTEMATFGRGLQMPASQAYSESALMKSLAQQQVDAALGISAEPSYAGLAPAASGEALVDAGTVAAPAAESALAAEAGAGAGAAGLGAVGAEAAGAAGTAAATEGLAAAGAGLGAAGLVGTAIPVIGAGIAAYGIGSALGWWADGGHVTPTPQVTAGMHAKKGGEVSGPGGPKDDLVPAMLSNDEYVMPVGAVRYFGLDKLDKMRQKGLEYERQLGIA